jgi:hypothetical protein
MTQLPLIEGRSLILDEKLASSLLRIVDYNPCRSGTNDLVARIGSRSMSDPE